MRTVGTIEPGRGAEDSVAPPSVSRFIGIDAGAETIKLLELIGPGPRLQLSRRRILEHCKNPGPVLLKALHAWEWNHASGAAITGRFSSQVRLPRIPTKQAELKGYRFFFGNRPGTIINIGSHGFSVLELRGSGLAMFRENSRCSQGTGNFLRQLCERFSLTVEEASRLCAPVTNPAPLSGRCPVILKTDMTHLANKGEDRSRILAGLFDAVCENVMVLIKPGITPAQVLLTGGVARSERVRRVFAERLARSGMNLMAFSEDEFLTLDALGAALLAAEGSCELPALEDLLMPPRRLDLERLPALSESLPRIDRMTQRPRGELPHQNRQLILGFDIGSTGAKAVAIDAQTSEVTWEAYRQTLGDPVGAAQDLLRRFTASPAKSCPLVAFGATGSGREVVGSLLTSCYGKDSVLVVNEIVAHATGALYYNKQVDTIFEIGGQDAKYIRLAEGRIIDCAMNEACSAGTGSFIEEQGRKFSGIADVRELGCTAMDAAQGVSLGQHCSVFMAEVIDEAVAAGVQSSEIISGLYDSIIKNYLNRVKGNRSVGNLIFCQGMPFAADALVAAVARQTGSRVVVPPNPGTVGALGIALLAARAWAASEKHEKIPALAPTLFLNAKMEGKDSFHCRATVGCGGTGNKCRIDRLKTVVNDQRSVFTWGGGCTLHDKATRKRKLPNLTPDPFREREELLRRVIEPYVRTSNRPQVAISDEFMLKGLFPFFAAFFDRSGFDLNIVDGADQATLKLGIQAANVPYCSPMQLFHGLVAKMSSTKARWMFVPMLRRLPLVSGQRCSVVCPVVQAAPDLLRCALESRHPQSESPRLLSPQINFGNGNLHSKEFLASCAELALALGLSETEWRNAWQVAVSVQEQFDAACGQLVKRALQFCADHDIIPVVVLGRNYTIYNTTLNSNVPAILREQGAVAIPSEYYPVSADVPLFKEMYWGYGQNILRATYVIRRTPGVYAFYCSNYSCGPDSFNLHLAAYLMEGKPFAIIETDGHSGDAGTRTRVEAFLHCVEQDRQASRRAPVLNEFSDLAFGDLKLQNVGRQKGGSERVLIPYLGPASQAVAAVLRGVGLNAEALPSPDVESLRLGRRFTSGKECLPMPLTLGALLQRLEAAKPGEHFVYLMPSTDGPCRFGVYNLLNQIVLRRLGWKDRVRIWSPNDSGYFDDLPAGTEMLMLAGIVATDLLRQALYDVRPVEKVTGKANALFCTRLRELLSILEKAGRSDLRLGPALWQVASGRLFGLAAFLRETARDFATLRDARPMPLVEMTGEIYVRAVDFSNDHLIEKLEERGLQVRLAPQSEWLAYCGYIRRHRDERNRLADHFSNHVQHRIEALARAAMASRFDWPPPLSIQETLRAAQPYIDSALEGEAVLTVGAALEAWRRHQVDAVVAVGPLECMPTKIAEAQFHHIAERDGLLTLTLAFNGDPVSSSALDNFAFEVHSRFRNKNRMPGTHHEAGASKQSRAPQAPEFPSRTLSAF